MDEYISKEDAINALLDKGQHSRRYGLGETWELNLMEIQEAINAIPAIDVQLAKWISVDDRLPNVGERVLVNIPRPDNHYNVEIAYISEGNDDYPYWVLRDKSQFYSTRFHYISHWQPLPESIKEGDIE